MAKISRWLPLTALAGVAIGGGLWLGLAGPSEKPAALPATADAPLPGALPMRKSPAAWPTTSSAPSCCSGPRCWTTRPA